MIVFFVGRNFAASKTKPVVWELLLNNAALPLLGLALDLLYQ